MNLLLNCIVFFFYNLFYRFHDRIIKHTIILKYVLFKYFSYGFVCSNTVKYMYIVF